MDFWQYWLFLASRWEIVYESKVEIKNPSIQFNDILRTTRLVVFFWFFVVIFFSFFGFIWFS